MKTKQSLKKLIINPKKAIRLKFDNIHLENKENVNAIINSRDINLINDIEKSLIDVINQKGSLSCEDAAVCLELIRKFKRLVENQIEPAKLQFRIAKSARKLKYCDRKNEAKPFRQTQGSDQQEKILNISTFTSNDQVHQQGSTSFFYQSQTCQTEASPYLKSKPSPVQLFKMNPPLKLKIGRANSYETQGAFAESQKIKTANANKNSEIEIQKLKTKIQSKIMLQSMLKQNIEQLQSQIRRIKAEKAEILNIDLKYSLKVIPQESISQSPNKTIKKSKFQPTSYAKLPQTIIEEYETEMKNHLQLIIVSQNQLIQKLYSKLNIL